MTAPQWEPSAEAVEALAKELHEAHQLGLISLHQAEWCQVTCDVQEGRRHQARFVLRRQHAREAGLLTELSRRNRVWWDATTADVIAAHAKLDAPKVPTLLEAAKDILASAQWNGVKRDAEVIAGGALAALKAAVEREEKRA